MLPNEKFLTYAEMHDLEEKVHLTWEEKELLVLESKYKGRCLAFDEKNKLLEDSKVHEYEHILLDYKMESKVFDQNEVKNKTIVLINGTIYKGETN